MDISIKEKVLWIGMAYGRWWVGVGLDWEFVADSTAAISVLCKHHLKTAYQGVSGNPLETENYFMQRRMRGTILKSV